MAYFIVHGELSGLVLHTCDNPACANPRHLSLGSPQDNMDDMMRKRRHRTRPVRGVDHPKAKLSEEDVKTVRALALGGHKTRVELARQYGLGYTYLCKLVNGSNWRHL